MPYSSKGNTGRLHAPSRPAVPDTRHQTDWVQSPTLKMVSHINEPKCEIERGITAAFGWLVDPGQFRLRGGHGGWSQPDGGEESLA
ncbi:hypothetical protein NPIL_508611 [Nephila pilipes]|uniref:Uncharacterized protein n=1 Tax=Nephila pilipes TaxID=299642 RepID=A0A8X6KLA6_NEPPI|nr:hypothetical protein NPIL_508611 [Nephila pilipes]